MYTHFLIRPSVLFSFWLLLVSSLSPFSSQAEDQQPTHSEDRQLKGAVIIPEQKAPPKDRPGDMSPSATEDALKTCLTRIPKDASVGQRMMAESTCQREEALRQPY